MLRNSSAGPGCGTDQFSREEEECEDWVWDTAVFRSTAVTEWGLVCGKQMLVDLGFSVYSLGVLGGVLVPGLLADRFGRKKMMFLSMGLNGLSTIASAFVTDFVTFLTLRALMGFGTLGTFVTMCILAVELAHSRHKTLVGNLSHLLWAPGQLGMAALAWWLRDWRHLHLATALPTLAALLLYPVTPESPRWLLARGREREARAVIAQLCRGKKSDSPAVVAGGEAGRPNQSALSLLSLLASPGVALATIVLSINWLVVDFCYYGLSLHSVNLAGDIFVNFILSALVEVPAVLAGLAGLDWAGRVPLLVGGQLVGGAGESCDRPRIDRGLIIYIGCILAGLVSPPAVLPLALIGKFSSSLVFLTVYLYTGELYPTSVRGLGLALTATCARLGGFIAPFIAGLGVRQPSLPFLIFGGAAIVGGLAALLLPETRGAALPATMQDMEKIVRRSRGSSSANMAYETQL